MAYYNTNTAVAYDMTADPYMGEEAFAPALPQRLERPRLDVVGGAGREANQAVSPVFTRVIKVALVLVAMFFALGVARVTIASATAATLNGNAQLNSTLETAQEESSNLEVMRSVYGATTRIRDLAAGTLGMVEAEGGVTVDVSASPVASVQ